MGLISSGKRKLCPGQGHIALQTGSEFQWFLKQNMFTTTGSPGFCSTLGQNCWMLPPEMVRNVSGSDLTVDHIWRWVKISTKVTPHTHWQLSISVSQQQKVWPILCSISCYLQVLFWFGCLSGQLYGWTGKGGIIGPQHGLTAYNNLVEA